MRILSSGINSWDRHGLPVSLPEIVFIEAYEDEHLSGKPGSYTYLVTKTAEHVVKLLKANKYKSPKFKSLCKFLGGSFSRVDYQFVLTFMWQGGECKVAITFSHFLKENVKKYYVGPVEDYTLSLTTNPNLITANVVEELISQGILPGIDMLS